MRSLVVHPRDHDLAIGTFGRAIYILDDVRPLRGMAGGNAPEAVTLFPTPDAYIARIAAMDGYHFSGDAMFKGETRMRGAMLTYWVPEDAGSVRAEIEIMDSSGETIRTMNGRAEEGLNRMAWNLRVSLPGGEEAEQGGGGGGFRGASQGPEVVPGDYMVRVTVGEQSSEQPLRVLPDPRVEVPMADRMAKFEASMDAALMNQRFTAAQRRLREVNEAIDKVMETLDGMEGDDVEAIREAGQALKDALEEGVDFGPANSQRRGLFALQSSWDAPTTLERTAMERFETALGDIEASLNEMIQGAVADFRAQLAGAQLELFPEFDTVGR